MFLGSRSPICTPVCEPEIATELVYEFWLTDFEVLRSVQPFGLTDGLNRTDAVPVVYPAIPTNMKQHVGWSKSSRIKYHGKLVTIERHGGNYYYGPETYDGDTWECINSLKSKKYVDHFGDVYLFKETNDNIWVLFNYRTRETKYEPRLSGQYMVSEYNLSMIPLSQETLGMANPRFKVYIFDETKLSVVRIEDQERQVSFFRRLNLNARPVNTVNDIFAWPKKINIWHVHGSWLYYKKTKFDLNEASKKAVLLLGKKLPPVLLHYLYSFIAIFII